MWTPVLRFLLPSGGRSGEILIIRALYPPILPIILSRRFLSPTTSPCIPILSFLSFLSYPSYPILPILSSIPLPYY